MLLERALESRSPDEKRGLRKPKTTKSAQLKKQHTKEFLAEIDAKKSSLRFNP